MPTFKCKQCTREFQRSGRPAIYCSFACRGIAQRKREAIWCEHCGKSFEAPPSHPARFCSRQCYEAGRERREVEARFWEKVAIKGENDCWLWTAGLSSTGYGKFGIRDGQTIGAHIFSYEMVNGHVPDGKQLNHTCDVRPCVNPKHVYPGTSKQNTHDAIDRKRLANGERHGMAKLTKIAVLEIRRRFAAGETNAAALSREYNVHEPHILRIIKRQRWQYV
jgi:hypothetical protein